MLEKEKKKKKYVRRFSVAKSRILYIVIVKIAFGDLYTFLPSSFLVGNLPERTVWNDGIEVDLQKGNKKLRK